MQQEQQQQYKQKSNEQVQSTQQTELTSTKVNEATFNAMRQAALSMFKQRTKDLTKVAELQQEVEAAEEQVTQLQSITTQLQQVQANLENAIETEENKVKQRTEQVQTTHEHVQQLAESQTHVHKVNKATSRVALQLKNFVQDIYQDGGQLRLLCTEARRVINNRSLHEFRNLCGDLRRRRVIVESLIKEMQLNVTNEGEVELEENSFTDSEGNNAAHNKISSNDNSNSNNDGEHNNNSVVVVTAATAAAAVVPDEPINKQENNEGMEEMSTIINTNVTTTRETLAHTFMIKRVELMNMLQEWLDLSNVNSWLHTNNDVKMNCNKVKNVKWQDYAELQEMHGQMLMLLEYISKSIAAEEEKEHQCEHWPLEEQQEEAKRVSCNVNVTSCNNSSNKETEKRNEENIRFNDVELNEIFPHLPLVKITMLENREEEEEEQYLSEINEEEEEHCKHDKTEDEVKNIQVDAMSVFTVTDNIVIDENDCQLSEAQVDKVTKLIEKYTSNLDKWCAELQRVHSECNLHNVHLSCNKLVPISSDDYCNEESADKRDACINNNNDDNDNDNNRSSISQNKVCMCKLMHSIGELKHTWEVFRSNYCDYITQRATYIADLHSLQHLQAQVHDKQHEVCNMERDTVKLESNVIIDDKHHTSLLQEEVENYVRVATRAHNTLAEQAKTQQELQHKIEVEETLALTLQEEISKNNEMKESEEVEWNERISNLRTCVQKEEERHMTLLIPERDHAHIAMESAKEKLSALHATCDSLTEHITSKDNDSINNDGNTTNNIGELLEQTMETAVDLLPQNVSILNDTQICELIQILLRVDSYDDDNKAKSNNEDNEDVIKNPLISESQVIPELLAMQSTQEHEEAKEKVDEEQEIDNCTLVASNEENISDTVNSNKENNIASTEINAHDKEINSNIDKDNNKENNDAEQLWSWSQTIHYWTSLLPSATRLAIGHKLKMLLQERQSDKAQHDEVMKRIAQNIELLQQVCSQVQCEQTSIQTYFEEEKQYSVEKK